MKSIGNILFSGFTHRKLITTIYLLQFVMAITVGLQVYNVLDASIGNSLSINGLKYGNAHMVINDLLNTHGPSLSPVLGQARWMMLVYLIFAAFIHGGIWNSLIHTGAENAFWNGGATYFFKCLGCGMIWTFLLLIWSAVLWIPYISRITIWMEQWPSEAPILWIGVLIFFIWLIGVLIFFVASCYSKVFIIRDDRQVLKSVWKGLKTGIRQTFRVVPILLIFATATGVLYAIHAVIDDSRILASTIGIFILFFIQQLIVWIKIGLRISTYRYLLHRNV